MSWKEIGRSEKIDVNFIFNEFPNACVEACQVLHEGAKAFLAGDKQGVKKYADDVIQHETNIDEIKDKIMMMLGSVRALPYMAIDYFTLVNDLDGVADRAEIAARLMRTHVPPVPSEIQGTFIKLSESVVDTVQLLAEAVAALLDNYDVAWDKARVCELARHNAVELHYEILEAAINLCYRSRRLPCGVLYWS